jgi:hypothetical protein
MRAERRGFCWSDEGSRRHAWTAGGGGHDDDKPALGAWTMSAALTCGKSLSGVIPLSQGRFVTMRIAQCKYLLDCTLLHRDSVNSLRRQTSKESLGYPSQRTIGPANGLAITNGIRSNTRKSSAITRSLIRYRPVSTASLAIFRCVSVFLGRPHSPPLRLSLLLLCHMQSALAESPEDQLCRPDPLPPVPAGRGWKSTSSS